MNYEERYGLSKDDMQFIDKDIEKANIIFAKIEEKPNPINESRESPAIENYLNSL